ncbi:MAG: peptidylprolyl isomerase [Magnetovibrio sp.]|nr:peptidylprolyl isomerase [Magnetovibrio sp.]
MFAIFNHLSVFLLVIFFSSQLFASGSDPVVAIVDGQKIVRSDIEAAQKLLPREYQALPIEKMFPMLVDTVIDTKLAAADARNRKLDEAPSFITRLNRIRDQLLQRIALQQEINREIDENYLYGRYKKMIKGLERKEEIHARHILLKSEKEALEAIKKLDKGADFAELAIKESTGPSGPKGGDLGFFGKGQMVPEFEKAAFGIKNGKYSLRPVKTNFGYHVIKVEARRKMKIPSYDSIVDKLRDDILQERAKAYVDRLRKSAVVERFTLDGEPLQNRKHLEKRN